MKATNEFDELARRKLGEGTFPFHEADWLEAERMIEALQAKRKRRGAIWFVVGGLGLLGAGAWWYSGNTRAEGTVAENKQTSVVEQQQAGPTERSVAQNQAQQKTTDPLSPGAEQNDDVVAAEKAEQVRPQSVPEPSHKASSKTQRASTQSTSQPRSAAPTQPVVVISATTVPGTETKDELTENSTGHTEAPRVPETPAAAGSTLPYVPSPDTTATENAPDEPYTEEPMAEGPATPTADPAEDTTGTPEPVVMPPATPWELSALVGYSSARATYGGERSEEWNNTSERGSAPVFGAELMRMGNNFGIGLGLHYATYKERMKTDATYANVQQVIEHTYLVPVQTSLFMITDSIVQGDTTIYIGQNTGQTIYVLSSTTDTVNTSVVARAAREQVNRVSYLEIPLLLDAHLVQGRWNVGLRGGPTVGLLSSRVGALPNGTADGYTDLNDMSFQAITFGYTARAYVRYRWNAAWSLGFEPGTRGQLSDELNEQGLSRRATAWDVMLSLSYRLP